jgi:hypothetical protein
VATSAWSPVRCIVVALGSIVVIAGLTGSAAEAGRSSPSRLSYCWRFVPSPNGIDTNSNWLMDVSGTATDDVWAVGQFQFGPLAALIEHWDGSAWSLNATIQIGSADTYLMDVDALSASDAWAVGTSRSVETLIEHWDGSAWSRSPAPSPGESSHLSSVAAISPSDAWAVGWSSWPLGIPLVLHWDGTRWSTVATPVPGSTLVAIDALSSDDVWAVGQWSDGANAYPLAEHWDGTSWSQVPTPAIGGSLSGVVAISSTDAWAVGGASGPLSIHWDGAAWTEVPMAEMGIFEYVNDVDASSSLDVWAVGDATPNWEDWRGAAQRWGGHRWSERRVPYDYLVDMHFLGLDVVAPGDAWAVGYTDTGSTLTQHVTSC